MSKRWEDLTGQVFGKLTAVSHDPDRKDLAGKRFWKCECTCGRTLVVRSDNLKSGHSTQCKECSYDFRGGKKVKRFELERK